MSFWLTVLSSATRIRPWFVRDANFEVPFPAADGLASRGRSGVSGPEGEVSALASVNPSRVVNQNVEPWPGRISTPISPPIISASVLHIASPSPVPPNLRVVDFSACVKDWKRRAWASGEMPIPVSDTSRRTVISFSD